MYKKNTPAVENHTGRKNFCRRTAVLAGLDFGGRIATKFWGDGGRMAIFADSKDQVCVWLYTVLLELDCLDGNFPLLVVAEYHQAMVFQ